MTRKTLTKLFGILIIFLMFTIINITTSEANIIEELRPAFDMENRANQFADLKSSTSYVTSVTITGPSTVEVGKTITLTAKVSGVVSDTMGEFTDVGVTWRLAGASGIVRNDGAEEGSSYDGYGTIKITGLTKGTVTITATSKGTNESGVNVTGTKTITVVSASSSEGDSGGDSGDSGGGDSGGSDTTGTLSVNPTNASIAIGETVTINIYNTSSSDVRAQCSNCDVVTYSAGTNSLIVRGVAAGSTTFTFYLEDNPSVKAYAYVTVGSGSGGGGGTTGTPTISVTPKNATIKVGEYVNFYATIQNCEDCQWIMQCVSGNCNIISMNAATNSIRVDGLEPGTVTLRCYITSYPSVYQDVVLTIEANTVAVTGISLNKQTMTLTQGTTEKLTATITPSNATNKGVNWTTSNSGVATVDSNGTVSAVSAGTAVITATTQDGGKTATCLVTVNQSGVSVTGITLNKNATTLKVGENETLIATVTPDNATNKKVIWDSYNKAVATVDQNGKITALSAGSARISATTEDGGQRAFCTVTVELKDSVVSSTKYVVTEEAILRILPKTTKQEFLRNITVREGTPIIHPKDSETEIAAQDLIKTGMKMDVGNKTYTLIVIGDINADGDCRLVDLSNLKLHLASLKKQENEYYLAADMDLDNKVGLTDLSIMMRYLVGLYKF